MLISGQVSKQAKHQTGNPADLPGGQPHGFVKKNKPFYSFPQKEKEAQCHHWEFAAPQATL